MLFSLIKKVLPVKLHLIALILLLPLISSAQYVPIPIEDTWDWGKKQWTGDSWVQGDLRLIRSATEYGYLYAERVVYATDVELNGLLEGETKYDAETGSLVLGTRFEQTKLNIGLELWNLVKNDTGLTSANGVPVYINGVSGNHPTIDIAYCDTALESDLVGVITVEDTISSLEQIFITTNGTVGMDVTAFAVAEDSIYLTTSGNPNYYQTTAPHSLGNKYYNKRVGKVLISHSTLGRVLLLPGNDPNEPTTLKQAHIFNDLGVDGTAWMFGDLIAGASVISLASGTIDMTDGDGFYSNSTYLCYPYGDTTTIWLPEASTHGGKYARFILASTGTVELTSELGSFTVGGTVQQSIVRQEDSVIVLSDEVNYRIGQSSRVDPINSGLTLYALDVIADATGHYTITLDESLVSDTEVELNPGGTIVTGDATTPTLLFEFISGSGLETVFSNTSFSATVRTYQFALGGKKHSHVQVAMYTVSATGEERLLGISDPSEQLLDSLQTHTMSATLNGYRNADEFGLVKLYGYGEGTGGDPAIVVAVEGTNRPTSFRLTIPAQDIVLDYTQIIGLTNGVANLNVNSVTAAYFDGEVSNTTITNATSTFNSNVLELVLNELASNIDNGTGIWQTEHFDFDEEIISSTGVVNVVNPGAEDGVNTPWTQLTGASNDLRVTTGYVHTGTYSWEFYDAPHNDNGLMQLFALPDDIAGTVFTATAWGDLRSGISTGSGRLKIRFLDSSLTQVGTTANSTQWLYTDGGTWIERSVSNTAPTGAAYVTVDLYVNQIVLAPTMNFDDVSMTSDYYSQYGNTEMYAEDKHHYLLNTSGSSGTVYCVTAPTMGTSFTIKNVNGDNTITINGNGETIRGATDTIILDEEFQYALFIYDALAADWAYHTVRDATSGAGTTGITVQDEGTPIIAGATTTNYVGDNVTVTDVGGVATITVTGSAGGSVGGVTASLNGSAIITDASEFNFTGNVTVTDAGSGVADVQIGDITGTNTVFEEEIASITIDGATTNYNVFFDPEEYKEILIIHDGLKASSDINSLVFITNDSGATWDTSSTTYYRYYIQRSASLVSGRGYSTGMVLGYTDGEGYMRAWMSDPNSTANKQLHSQKIQASALAMQVFSYEIRNTGIINGLRFGTAISGGATLTAGAITVIGRLRTPRLVSNATDVIPVGSPTEGNLLHYWEGAWTPTADVTINNATIEGDLDIGLTAGSVLFEGVTGITEDNSNFYWDDTANELRIGGTTDAGVYRLQITGGAYVTDYIFIDDTPADIELTNGTMNTDIADASLGAWARGHYFRDSTGATILGGVGLLGSGAAATRFFMAHGTTPHNTGTGIYVRTSGEASVGTITDYGAYILQTNGDVYVNDDLYAVGDVSALTFTDRTPGIPDTAENEILAVTNTLSGGIDHSTLGSAEVIRDVTRIYTEIRSVTDTTLYKRLVGGRVYDVTDMQILLDENGIAVNVEDVTAVIVEEQETEHLRDIGKTVTMTVGAIQKLHHRVKKQGILLINMKARIETLETYIQNMNQRLQALEAN